MEGFFKKVKIKLRKDLIILAEIFVKCLNNKNVICFSYLKFNN